MICRRCKHPFEPGTECYPPDHVSDKEGTTLLRYRHVAEHPHAKPARIRERLNQEVKRVQKAQKARRRNGRPRRAA